jgi:CRP-like cAMP-binding protein
MASLYGREARFRAVPLFADLSAKDLRVIASLATYLELPAGSKLTRQRAVGHEFVVVFDGEADVIQHGTTVATRGPGDFFGESAVLGHVPRTSTVVARTPVSIAVIAEPEFREMLATFPALGVKLAHVLAQRLLEAQGQVSSRS